MALRLLTGLSKPTAVAWLASVISDEAIGSLVKVTCANAASRAAVLRPLPVRLASSAFAAVSAADLLPAMKEFARFPRR